MSPAETLCAHHAQRQNQRASEAAQELLACGTDFGDAASVNRFLGALVKQVTLKRIPRRDAINREESLRREESRVAASRADTRPTELIWDILGPPYEGSEPAVTIIPAGAMNQSSGRR